MCRLVVCISIFFFQAEDGIRDLVRSRGLGDVYKRQAKLTVFESGRRGLTMMAWLTCLGAMAFFASIIISRAIDPTAGRVGPNVYLGCLLYTSDAADERSSVDLGGRRIIQKKKQNKTKKKKRHPEQIT